MSDLGWSICIKIEPQYDKKKDPSEEDEFGSALEEALGRAHHKFNKGEKTDEELGNAHRDFNDDTGMSESSSSNDDGITEG